MNHFRVWSALISCVSIVNHHNDRMSDRDPVALVSERICTHMNTDHIDSMMHLTMHHAKLPKMPAWCHMESICATHIVIRYRYASEEQDEGPEKHDALSTIQIDLDPPLESVQAARKRLVQMSKSSEEQNERYVIEVCVCQRTYAECTE